MIYNATVHCLIAKVRKKNVIGDTGLDMGKMLSMAAGGLKCKVFMGSKDIKRQRPNVEAEKNGAVIVPVTTVKHLRCCK